MKINQALLEEALRIKVNVLRTRINNPMKSIMVTSANHGEGTSTLVVNLAFAFALGDKSRVLLVDANIRRPSLHKLFELERRNGFLDFITRCSRSAVPQVSGLIVLTTHTEKSEQN